MPAAGQPAPDFTLAADDGGSVTLSALRGRPVVVYFYPRDDTPGCTAEACDFRDLEPAWAGELGAVVIGISPDGTAAHARFKARYGIGFRLLSDPSREVLRAWGAWGKKVMYGKEIDGVIRSTFLVDRDGTIARAWPRVAVKGHAAAVVAAIRALGQ